MRVILHWLHDAKDRRNGRISRLMTWFSRTTSQNIAQYILAFSLPFFVATQKWVYLGFTFMLFLSTLWDPWWVRLARRPLYLSLLQQWALLCALGYLYPFFWPDAFGHFYQAMLLVALIAVLPARRTRPHLTASAVLALWALTVLILLPGSERFPVLSVWVNRPHFAFDTDGTQPAGQLLPDDMPSEEIVKFLAEGHSLCCVAPVVAPPDVRENVTQGWSVDGATIERPQLATLISGNALALPFRSYYCKHHFPRLNGGMVVTCDLYLADKVHVGQARLPLR